MDDALGVMFLWYIELWGYKKYSGLLLLGGFTTGAIIYAGGSSDFLSLLCWGSLLLASPFYTIGGSVALWLAAEVITDNPPTTVMFAEFKFAGCVWGVMKMLGYAAHTRARDKIAEEQERRREEEERLCEEEKQKREEEKRKYEEERRKRKNEERQPTRAKDREQARIRNERRAETSQALDQISDLISSCRKPASEMMHVAKALSGADSVDPWRVVLHDVATILRVFVDVYGSRKRYIVRLWSEVQGLARVYSTAGSLDDYENCVVKQMGMVSLLAMYDITQKTNLASQAASAYLSIVLAVRSHCGNSIAAQVVADAYTELLRPYILDKTEDGNAGRSNSSSSRTSVKGTECEKCVNGYRFLGLPYGTSADEVNSKRLELSEVLHPDKLGDKSEKVRHAAEQHLMGINESRDHILECRASRSL